MAEIIRSHRAFTADTREGRDNGNYPRPSVRCVTTKHTVVRRLGDLLLKAGRGISEWPPVYGPLKRSRRHGNRILPEQRDESSDRDPKLDNLKVSRTFFVRNRDSGTLFSLSLKIGTVPEAPGR